MIIGSRHNQPDRNDAAEPQNAEGQGLSESRQARTRERRPNALTASISAFPGTSAGITRGTERGLRQATDTKTTSGTTPEGAHRRRYQPGQWNPVAATVRRRLQSPETARQARESDANQRHGLNPGHDERHSPRRCIAALSPTAARQSVPGASAARRRTKPRTQPAGSAARRHPGSNPREPTRRSSGVATISPSAATQRNPKTPKDKASADQGRQRQGDDGRTRLPPRFRPFPVRPPGLPVGRNAA